MNKMICITTYNPEDKFRQHFYVYDENARDMDEAIRLAVHEQAVRYWEERTNQDRTTLSADEIIEFMKNEYISAEAYHEQYEWSVLMSEVNSTMKNTAEPAKNSEGYIVSPHHVTTEPESRWIGECK